MDREEAERLIAVIRANHPETGGANREAVARLQTLLVEAQLEAAEAALSAANVNAAASESCLAPGSVGALN